MSDAEIWSLITSESKKMPQWIRKMHSFDVADLLRNQKFRSETKDVDSSYLQFLEQQIALEPRGPEWTEVLKRRSDALRPFIGKKITTVFIVENNRMATIRIDPDRGYIFDIEEN